MAMNLEKIQEWLAREMSCCTLCPRQCHADRRQGQGYCHGGAEVRLALVSLHLWEEPVFAGEKGAGTVFFSGCNMGCVFCQNHEISSGGVGREVSIQRLAEIFLEQQRRGAACLDLVTPTHYAPHIVYSLYLAKQAGFKLPVLYNTSGYETIETLTMLADWVDIFLPDLKYYDSGASQGYSQASDYFSVASEAIKYMVKLKGENQFSEVRADSGNQDNVCLLMQQGVLVRHMVLPGYRRDSMKLLDWLWDSFADTIYLSLMNQYTPMFRAGEFKKINRRLTTFEYDSVVNYAYDKGFRHCFIQDRSSASQDFVPNWTFDGV